MTGSTGDPAGHSGIRDPAAVCRKTKFRYTNSEGIILWVETKCANIR